MKLSLSFAPIKSKETQWWARPSLQLIPWIHFSSFLLSSVAGCALYRGLKALHVSLYTSLHFKTVIPFTWSSEPKLWAFEKLFEHSRSQMSRYVSLLTEESSSPLPPSPWRIPRVSHFFLCPSWAFNCAFSPKHSPLDPSSRLCIYLVSLWKTLCHGLASAQPCGSCTAPKQRGHQLFSHSAWNVLLVAS